jgi:uncharacterized protein with PIN domain
MLNGGAMDSAHMALDSDCFSNATASTRRCRPAWTKLAATIPVAPPTPWTRCTACNGPLVPARKAEIEQLLPPGTRHSYQTFARCAACGRVYWRGAHSKRLEPIVQSAIRAVAAADHRRG